MEANTCKGCLGVRGIKAVKCKVCGKNTTNYANGIDICHECSTRENICCICGAKLGGKKFYLFEEEIKYEVTYLVGVNSRIERFDNQEEAYRFIRESKFKILGYKEITQYSVEF